MEKHNNNLFSEIISFIRFPMICGIILIHSKNNNFIEEGINLPIYNFLSNILSDGIARICVPLFFFISGFLFFYKIEKWDMTIYKQKINKRKKSLLYPYVIYITLAIGVFALLQHLMPFLLSGANKPISEWNFIDFLMAYWQYGSMNIPFVGPLWFIRNLMVIALLSPAIYIYIYYFKFSGVVLLGMTWICGYKEFSIPGSMGLFFFSLGAFYSITKTNILLLLNKIRLIWIVYPLLLLWDTISKQELYNEYLHRITIICGIIFFIKSTAWLITKYKVQFPMLLTSSSFFIYAIHEPYYDQIRKVLFRILPLSNNHVLMDLQMSVYYLFIAIGYISVLLLIFFMLKRYTPTLCKILSGGR